MKKTMGYILVVALGVGAWANVEGADLKDKVRVQIESVGLHPGMDPGMYVCASGHLHIKGTVENRADVPLGPVKVAGKAFDAAGNLLGTATAATTQAVLPPGEKAEINVEFLTVTGPQIQQVEKHEVTVVEAAPSRR